MLTDISNESPSVTNVGTSGLKCVKELMEMHRRSLKIDGIQRIYVERDSL